MHAVFSESHRRHQPTRFLRRGEWADYPEVPTVPIQEDGYDRATLGGNLTAFLEGFGRG